MKEKFLQWAARNGWNIAYDENSHSLNNEILLRYPDIPAEYRNFMDGLSCCCTADETTWFLTAKDYEPQPEDHFQYNEFEQISLDAAKGDDALLFTITQFWNQHFPIMISVANGYEYHAISLNSGKIITGYEPEFEDSADHVADSFEDFLQKIMDRDDILS